MKQKEQTETKDTKRNGWCSKGIGVYDQTRSDPFAFCVSPELCDASRHIVGGGGPKRNTVHVSRAFVQVTLLSKCEAYVHFL